MNRRAGASLLNVMVFIMFAVMLTAQVFFFAKSSADSVSEQRGMMMYRMNLDALVDVAKSALKAGEIVHSVRLDNTGGALKFSEFSEGARAKRDTAGNTDWEVPSEWKGEGYKGVYSLDIYDLDYSFDKSGFSRSDWTDGGYGTSGIYRKPFASMFPLGEIERYTSGDLTSDDISSGLQSGDIKYDGAGKPVYAAVYSRFFLIRAWTQLPESYYGMRLMYQVLVSRDEQASPHSVDILSFQEVWF